MMLDRWLALASGTLAVALVRGLAVFAVALPVALASRRLPAEARHLAWFLLVLAFLLAPVAWLTIPSVSLGPFVPVTPDAGHRLVAAPLLSRQAYVHLVDRALDQAVVAGQDPSRPARWAALAVVAAWFAGVLALSARFLAGQRRVRRVLAAARRDVRLESLAASLAPRLRRRGLQVLTSGRCRMPFTTGWARPRVCLPAAAAVWRPDRAAAVLTHELAHVARRDIAWQNLAYAVCLACWFVPPAWVAYAAMLREAEACCDQAVIDRGFRPAAYARDIVALLRASRGRILAPVHAAALARERAVLQRIGAVLRLEPGRGPPGILASLAIAAVCLACLLPLLAVSGTPRALRLAADDPVFATWVNPSLGENAWAYTKYVVLPDGRKFGYLRETDTEPVYESHPTYEEVWVDAAGARWYRGRFVAWSYPSGAGRSTGYFLYRLDVERGVLETASSQTGYPVTVDPVLSPRYLIAWRRP